MQDNARQCKTMQDNRGLERVLIRNFDADPALATGGPKEAQAQAPISDGLRRRRRRRRRR
eukprot:5057652-Pyramimonas_sp.AAC.1